MHKEAFRIVYSNKKYLAISGAVFVVLLVSLSIVSELIFLSPTLVFYLPTYAITNFALVVIISALSGIVTSMSIYRIRMTKSVRKSGIGFVGSIIGTVWGAATSFLTNYETPLRLVSIAILCYTYFVTIKDITIKCKITK